METRKALKSVTVWNCIFCFSCILSTICFAIGNHYNAHILFAVGIVLFIGWLLNPFAIVSCFRCLKIYHMERKCPDQKEIIGRKWIWALVWPVITTVLWIFGGLLFAKFTGGV